MKNIIQNLFGPPRLTQVEGKTLDAVLVAVPDSVRSILIIQRDAIAKIQRIDAGREVDFYYKNKDTLPRVACDKEVVAIASLTIKSLDTGHEANAVVELVNGILFSINFTAPPNDLRNEKLSIEVTVAEQYQRGK
jgi:hypothetical protein